MKNSEDLRRALRAIDHKSYPAYKDLKGSYSFGNYVLSIDHVQGDPFASPSRLSILVDGKTAGFPVGLYDTRYKRVALQDYLNRLFYQEIEKYTFKAKGSGKSGLISVSRCGQEILERSAVTINPENGGLLFRFAAGFPGPMEGLSTRHSWNASSLISCRPVYRRSAFTKSSPPPRYKASSIWLRTSIISAPSCLPWICVRL